jgi:hypothetical protein
MATETSKPEPWRFCAICDPESERPFSVERAYIKHLSSQRHLRKTSQPLKAFYCPDCGKHFSRNTEVQRHLINGRCSGPPSSRLITDNTSASTKKHALSVSPNGVPWKINKTAACTTDATVGSPLHLASRVAVDHDTHQSPSPVVPHVTISPDIQTSRASTDENESESWIFEAHDAIRDVGKVPTTDPEEVEPSLHYRKEIDQWLSDAMMSASLKDNALAHVRIRPVVSSTPGTSLGSLGSLFLLRTPKISTPRFSFPSLPFSTTLVRSFARSAEIPAPMLTTLVGDDQMMAETSLTSAMIGPRCSTQEDFTVRPEDVSQRPRLARTASGVIDHIAASTQSAKQTLVTPSNLHPLFKSCPVPIPQRIRKPQSSIFVQNGTSLLHCASSGDDLGAYAILMKKYPVDINYWGVPDPIAFPEMQHTGTALMVAAEAGHYNVMYAVLKASAFKRTHRLDLNVTTMYRAAEEEAMAFHPDEDVERPYHLFLRTVVAILCCQCPEEMLASDSYDTTGCHGEDIRPVLGLGDCSPDHQSQARISVDTRLGTAQGQLISQSPNRTYNTHTVRKPVESLFLFP